MIALTDMESTYRAAIDAALDDRPPTPAQLVDISARLFAEIQPECDPGNPDSDMLLFQYGVYDWGNEHGRHFALDITRQVIAAGQYEPYQLSFTLIYDPAPFENTGFHERWSADFPDLAGFVAHIRAANGFKEALQHPPKTHTIHFNQC